MNEKERKRRDERQARKEAKRYGYEYRPVRPEDRDVARRLAEGFHLINESEDGDESDE